MSQEGLQKLQEAASAPPKVGAVATGPVYTFTFPASVRQYAEDPKTVSFTILDVGQEMHGNKLMEASDGNIWKKIALAIVKFDGRPCNWATGEIDARIEKMSPKAREQLTAGFMKLHRSTEKEDKDFLESMVAEG